MATTALTLQTIVRTGLNPSLVAAASGDGNVFDNSSRRVYLWVDNQDASPTTVSVDTPNAVDGLAIPSKDISVPAGEARLIGPFPAMYEQYDADNTIEQAVKVTYSSVTSLTVGAIYLPVAAA